MPSPFEPLDLGAVRVDNRVLMAPLTRMRATVPGDVPNALMGEYYVQRASAGLVISEGTQVSPEGKGYMDTPGIYSDEQVAGWRRVTDAVHEHDGRIVMQILHAGRYGYTPWSKSASNKKSPITPAIERINPTTATNVAPPPTCASR